MSGSPDIIKHGVLAKGKRELDGHQRGKKLSYRNAVLAKCYECMNGYADGKEDCRISGCPLYAYMPYRVALTVPAGKKLLTIDECAQVLELHKKGVGNNEIARVVGCSKGAVTNLVHFGRTSGRLPLNKK